MAVQTIVAIVTDENLRVNHQCFSKRLVLLTFINDITVHNNTKIIYDHPGDFGGNAHRGTRSHSIQSFGGPLHIKIA